MADDEPRPRELERRLDSIEMTVRAFGPVTSQVAGHEIKINNAAEDVHDLKRDLGAMEDRLAKSIKEVRQECQRFHDEYRSSLADKGRGRTAIVVAVIGGSATILGSLALSFVQILGGHG